MNYYNIKKIISYINLIFIIYLWVLILYGFFRYTDLIKSSPLGKILLIPINLLIDLF